MLLVRWQNPFGNVFSSLSKEIVAIVFTKDQLYHFRKPQAGCHCNVSQVMIKKCIARNQYSINHNVASHGHRGICPT